MTITKCILNSRSFLAWTACSLFLLIMSFSCTGNPPIESSHTPWQFTSQREEIAPGHWIDGEVRFEGKATLALSGDGKAYVNGCWQIEMDVKPGSFYEFRTCFLPSKIDVLNRSVLARIEWQGEDGKRIEQPEYPGTFLQIHPENH
jgi:hypothetical protein